jgi:uncharacterized protein (DUF488 family)
MAIGVGLDASSRERLDRRSSSAGREASAAHYAAVIERVWTIGYERLLPDMLVAELQGAGVRRVIDVRLRPQSRRPGMSKTKLALRLGEHGIAYEHWRELGTPIEIRVLYRKGATRAAANAYHDHLVRNAGDPLERLCATLSNGPPTALLCLEAEPAHCHRRVISDALTARNARLQVIDL